MKSRRFFHKSVHTKFGDDMNNSIWTKETQMPRFRRLEGDMKTDVLIVGGGLAGLLCAHRLHRAGVDYALIEADRIMHGVSRNTTAKLTSQHGLIYHKLIREFDADTARKYWQANETALAEYRELAQGLDCGFEERDNYIYSLDSVEKIRAELAALERIGAPAEFADSLPVPIPVAGAVRFRGQAQFHPLRFAAGIAEGLNIYENTKAREFVGNTVLTGQGKITASKIIMATHFPIINKHGAYFLKMYQSRSYVLALEGGPQVDGMYLDEAEGGISLRNYGELLLAGGGGHRTGKKGSGWRKVEDFARLHYPGTHEVCRWATQDCMTLDGMPYIGQYSKNTPDLYVATGFNKWGMTNAMVSAMLLSDLVQGRENPLTPVFDPSRRMLRPQLFVNGAEAAASLLTLKKPRCPHMGCALKWNPYERSWDCACHGSRFSEDGRVQNGPATGDLE